MKSFLLLLAFASACLAANNDGRYNPNDDGRYRWSPGQWDDGKYGGNAGRYIPDDSGKYRGGYGDKGDKGGHYVHVDHKYVHQDKKYTYTPDNRPYVHTPDKIPKYVNDPKPVAPAKRTKPAAEQKVVPSPSIISNAFVQPITVEPKTTKATTTRATTTRTTTEPPTIPPIKRGLAPDGWTIIRKVKKFNKDGYFFDFENENKIKAQESGRHINIGGDDHEDLKAKGWYEYIGDDGEKYRVEYTADENGFIPRAAHIPTPPPIPDLIQKALDYVARLNRNGVKK